MDGCNQMYGATAPKESPTNLCTIMQAVEVFCSPSVMRNRYSGSYDAWCELYNINLNDAWLHSLITLDFDSLVFFLLIIFVLKIHIMEVDISLMVLFITSVASAAQPPHIVIILADDLVRLSRPHCTIRHLIYSHLHKFPTSPSDWFYDFFVHWTGLEWCQLSRIQPDSYP